MDTCNCSADIELLILPPVVLPTKHALHSKNMNTKSNHIKTKVGNIGNIPHA